MNDALKLILPWLTTALTGPLGGMAASFVADKLSLSDKTVDAVKTVLNNMSPEDALKVKQLDVEFQEHMMEIGYKDLETMQELNVRASESVNKTMQAEAAAEHWPTYSWRPAIGFAVAWNLVSASIVVFIAYIFKPDLVAQIPGMLTAQAGLNAVAMPILGIASYFRGKAQADTNNPMPVKG